MAKFTKSDLEVLSAIMNRKSLPTKGKFNRRSSYHENAITKLKKEGVIYKGADELLYLKEPDITIRKIIRQVIPKELFNNISLYDDVVKNKFKYSSYGYTIDQNPDPHNKHWELSIVSTTLGELEGCEEGIVSEYTYLTKREAEKDAEILEGMGLADFELI